MMKITPTVIRDNKITLSLTVNFQELTTVSPLDVSGNIEKTSSFASSDKRRIYNGFSWSH